MAERKAGDSWEAHSTVARDMENLDWHRVWHQTVHAASQTPRRALVAAAATTGTLVVEKLMMGIGTTSFDTFRR